MKTIMKVLWIARVTALSLTPASAQPADLTKEGDYYAASKTIVHARRLANSMGSSTATIMPLAKQSSSDQPRKK